VEKDATFQKLLDGGVLKKLYPCILVTVSKLTIKIWSYKFIILTAIN
jgi:hypothetical protein